MKQTIKLTSIICLVIMYLSANAQIKVYSGGNVCVGSTTTTPSKPLDVVGSGGIQISQTADSSSTNELHFQDNGQIRSGSDNNHRIIFDRSSGDNILELREYGSLVFSPGATSGTRTQKVTFTSTGDIVLNGSSNSFKIGTDKILWHNNITSDIFVGVSAGSSTTGANNTFMGYKACYSNTTGLDNVAIGSNAMYSNTTGYHNDAIGFNALYYNTTGAADVALGSDALYNNTTASNNVAIGFYALLGNTTGASNTASGYSAGKLNITGSNNTFIGYGVDVASGSTGLQRATAIGNGTTVNANDQIRIGNGTVTSIGGQVGWTTLSDGRFKKDIVENVPGLSFILKLRPVTYHFDMDQLALLMHTPDSLRSADAEAIKGNMLQTGLIAQEVEQVSQQIGFDFSGVDKPKNQNDYYGLRYAEFVVPLVKAVQELSQHLDSLQTKTTKLDSTNTAKDATLQAMQDQINQLESIINSCCSIHPTKTMQENNTQSSLNSKDAELNSKNSVMLYQNKPNPFNNQTVIEYYIPANSTQSSIMIFDMQGKLIKTIALEQKENGSIIINAGSLLPGMYMYSLVVDAKEIDTKRMILTK